MSVSHSNINIDIGMDSSNLESRDCNNFIVIPIVMTSLIVVSSSAPITSLHEFYGGRGEWYYASEVTVWKRFKTIHRAKRPARLPGIRYLCTENVQCTYLQLSVM